MQYGFINLLPVADVVRVFGGNLKLSCIAVVSQEHLWPCAILDISSNPDEGAPSVNDTTDRDVAPESMKFGRVFP